ncbi:MAG: hypothetical protein NTV32_07695 [Gammaproteobacteria bacterium]|nr:hypothetical protein [Gammaproteobacteria bacterium]
MKKRNLRLVACLSALLSSGASVFADTGSPIPVNAIGTWVYNTTWPSTAPGALPWAKAGDVDDLWVNNISCYNGDTSGSCNRTNEPGTPGQPNTPAPSFGGTQNPINEIIYYGGDLEAYCGGTEQGPESALPSNPADLWACVPNSFYTSYYGPYMGMMKIGDPSVDTSKIMAQDIKKWVALHPNTFTLHDTCDNYDGAGCTLPQGAQTGSFWDTFVAGDLASKGTQAGAHTSSGLRAASEYANVYVDSNGTKPYLVADIDGRMDIADPDSDFLDGLNTMAPADAAHLADFIAKNICADDHPDGVQFDLEPFTFNSVAGPNGVPFTGTGQKPFYTEIAKDFAGYYGQGTNYPDSTAGINNQADAHGEYSDPLHCVDRAHPNGRFFSVFTFSGNVTPDVVSVFTKHNNGMIVDSLYDLTTSPSTIAAAAVLENAATGKKVQYTTTGEPGGYPTCPTTDVTVPAGTYPAYQYLVQAEISAMSQLNVPFQFGVPVGASAHEFESRQEYTSTGTKSTLINTFGAGNYCANEPGTPNQGSYVYQVLKAINKSGVTSNTNYKGIDVYGWSQQSWWTDVSTSGAPVYELMPDYPNPASLGALAAGPSAAATSGGY